ncbi:hypothetical protein [uncultured Methylophaga sp.]|uniref:hypothetical protein n=1 Tax=uncultured Methylophaga sp. TaxID=285271 RepID=UPI0030F69247
MFVKNQTARVITINVKGEKPCRTLPGNHPPVEISEKAAKTEFAKDCFKRGWLSLVNLESTDDDGDKPKTEKEQLTEDLEVLGVEVKKSWAIPKLKEERGVALETLTGELTELGVEVDADWSITQMQEELQKALDAE